jgi:predicted flavoprotein YhiN
VAVAPLRASNCGLTIPWSQHFAGKFAGHPLSNISLTVNNRTARGEAMISSYGLEGGAVYQLSAPLRDAIDAVYVQRVQPGPDRQAVRTALRSVGLGTDTTAANGAC